MYCDLKSKVIMIESRGKLPAEIFCFPKEMCDVWITRWGLLDLDSNQF